MSRETQMKALLLANSDIMSLLTGGIYTDEELGPAGFRRGDDAPSNPAFDPNTGNILPSAIIKQGGEQPSSSVRDQGAGFQAFTQTVTIYYFEFRGSVEILAASRIARDILDGVRLGKSYPIWLESQSPVVPDSGPVANSSVMVQNYVCVSTRVRD